MNTGAPRASLPQLQHNTSFQPSSHSSNILCSYFIIIDISPQATTMAPIALSAKHQDLLKAYIKVSKNEVSLRRLPPSSTRVSTDIFPETGLDQYSEQSRLPNCQVCARHLDQCQDQAPCHSQRGRNRSERPPNFPSQICPRAHENECKFEANTTTLYFAASDESSTGRLGASCPSCRVQNVEIRA